MLKDFIEEGGALETDDSVREIVNFIREKFIDEISLVGVNTNICVLYTAADARNISYRVNVYEDGVASFNPEAHKFALKEMETTLGCKII